MGLHVMREDCKHVTPTDVDLTEQSMTEKRLNPKSQESVREASQPESLQVCDIQTNEP